MKIKIFIILLSGILLLAFNTNAQNKPSISASPEIKNERGMYSKVFLKENGDHEAVLSSSPVHYQKNGAWEEINTMITSNNGSYQNESNVIQSYFPGSVDNSGKIKLIINSTDEIFIHSEKKLVLLNDQTNLTVLGGNSNNSIATVINNTITYSNIYADISDEFTVMNGEIKNNVVLSAPPTQLNNVSSGYFGFQEIVELPKGWKITSDDKTNGSFTSSALSISDSKGNRVLSIPEPVFFNNYTLASDGTNAVEGKYLVKQENSCWTVTTLVPVEWLKDANTKYPLSLDPTVVIAGTTGGWQSPNNFVDNSGFVFVGVCCGNLTHRAWVKFNISSIPANSCITNVEFQTTGATEASTNPEVILLNDVTGAFGPYGAITPAAYTDFGNGNYTSFTATTLAVYGYYSLGAAANVLLQAQLPGGWFQVALQFQNEPSTDWKNFSATSSNLRVTYSACVLPVELISFDATCNTNNVNLTWATASETNNKFFTLERSTDGTNYETIGTLAGAGNSSQTHNYSFVDEEPLKGTSYYRLKQTDFDGNYKYVKVIPVSCNNVAEFTIYPNPGTGIFTIEGAEQNSDIIITDVLGQVIFQTKAISKKTVTDLSNHPNGIYFIRVISKNGPVSKKIIINK
jgi:hypothetical protein